MKTRAVANTKDGRGAPAGTTAPTRSSRWKRNLIVWAFVGVALLVGWRVSSVMTVKDSDGVTRVEAELMSLREQFDLFGERYARLEELLGEAQVQVSSEEWIWLVKGIGAQNGMFAPTGALPGAEGENSYVIGATRAIHLPGAVGAREDAEPMLAYFESKGWATSTHDRGTGGFAVRALTEDGYQLEYQVQSNGQYNMTVYGGPFWGDENRLSVNVLRRIPARQFDVTATVPGVMIPFPKWSDPWQPRENDGPRDHPDHPSSLFEAGAETAVSRERP